MISFAGGPLEILEDVLRYVYFYPISVGTLAAEDRRRRSRPAHGGAEVMKKNCSKIQKDHGQIQIGSILFSDKDAEMI